MLYEDERDDESIIIIGADETVGRMARCSGASVKSFATVDEFDRWRAAAVNDRVTLRDEIVEALRQTGTEFDLLPKKLQPIVGFVARCRVVPGLAELETMFPRRSLYRLWNREIHETPARFLRRLRLLHADRLIAWGASKKEAALRAGFGSVDGMRRLMAQRERQTKAS